MSELASKSVAGADGLVLNLRDDPDDGKIKLYSKENIARAIMEGAVNLLYEQLKRMEEVGIKPKSAVMVGGPSANPMWHKLIEEICGISVRVIHGANAGAVGAAVLAGIGCGLYRDEKEAFEIFNKE
jgi:xylulokinase